MYKPILKILDDRASRVKDGLEAAEKNIKIQNRLENDQEKIVAEAKKEAKDIIVEAKKEAEDLVKKAQESAKDSAKKALEKERQAFESQMQQQHQEFKKEMVEVITSATNAVLKGVVDTKVQQDLVKKQIQSLNIQQFN